METVRGPNTELDTQMIEIIPEGETPPEKVAILSYRGASMASRLVAMTSSPVSWWPQLHNVPSHTGLYIQYSKYRAVVWETHSPEGWRGTPWELYEDRLKKPGRWAKLRYLNLTESQRLDLAWLCEVKMPEIAADYPEADIFRYWKYRAFGTLPRRTKKPFCSEAVALLLEDKEYGIGAYDILKMSGKPSMDLISPFDMMRVPLVPKR